MSGKLQFREKLKGILELGIEQNRVLSTEDVEKYFEEDCLSEEQMELVYDYLLSQKIAVNGYIKKGGTLLGAEKEEGRTALSEADKDYLEEYREELKSMRPLNAKEERLQQYFPRVIEIAEELYTPEFFIGDLIQEGNVGLMTALAKGQASDGEIVEGIRQSMQMLMEEQRELKRRDEKMVQQVAALDESLKDLTEELGRKPTLEELALYMELTEDEISDILRLTGEDDDSGEEDGGHGNIEDMISVLS